MKTTITTLSKILAATALLASAGLAQAAGSATADIAVSATIVAKCTISTTAVAFGDFDPFTGTDLLQEGAVTVGCTKGAGSLSVALGGGTNGTLAQRLMKEPITGDTLNYSLMLPSNNNPVTATCPAMGAGTSWGDTGVALLNLSSPGSYATRTYKVCGQLPKSQDKSVGAYSDTVVATINF